jgi:hypothetical protein
MTVPETPSPEVLMQQQQLVVLGTTNRRGGPGRHVSDTTPSKGRLAKAQRLDDGGMGGEPAAHPATETTVLPGRPSRRSIWAVYHQAVCTAVVFSKACCLICLALLAAGGVLYDGRGTYNDVIGYAERLFSRIRQTVCALA